MISQYIPLDVSDIFEFEDVSDRGSMIASRVENSVWFYENNTSFDPEKLGVLVDNLKYSTERTFDREWQKFCIYAETHGIWVNQ